MLSEVPHELSTAAHSKECKRSPQQFIPAGFPPHDNLQPGTEDSAIPLTTPDMVRSGRVLLTSVKSPSNSYIAQLRLLLSRRNLSIIRVKDVTVNTVMFRGV